MNEIRAKRVYDPPGPGDGFRVLVDRFWPRRMKKEQLQAELWLKDAAPGASLIKWFSHDRATWEEFKARYFAALDEQPEAVAKLLDEAARGPVTLLYSAKDTEYNQAVALQEYLMARARESK